MALPQRPDNLTRLIFMFNSFKATLLSCFINICITCILMGLLAEFSWMILRDQLLLIRHLWYTLKRVVELMLLNNRLT